MQAAERMIIACRVVCIVQATRFCFFFYGGEMEWIKLVANDVIVVFITLGCVFLLRNYFAAYFTEKAKNIATKEDIADITSEVEKVKLQYTAEIEKIRNQYTAEIEILKSELSRKSYVHSVQFEKEFNLLTELWEHLIDLKEYATKSIYKAFDLSKIDNYDEKSIRNINNEITEYVLEFIRFLESNRPFYPEGIYKALNKSTKLIDNYFFDAYRFAGLITDTAPTADDVELRREYIDTAKDNIKRLEESFDEVCELIRKRIVPEEGININ
jgi:hypothetical protein